MQPLVFKGRIATSLDRLLKTGSTVQYIILSSAVHEVTEGRSSYDVILSCQRIKERARLLYNPE